MPAFVDQHIQHPAFKDDDPELHELVVGLQTHTTPALRPEGGQMPFPFSSRRVPPRLVFGLRTTKVAKVDFYLESSRRGELLHQRLQPRAAQGLASQPRPADGRRVWQGGQVAASAQSALFGIIQYLCSYVTKDEVPLIDKALTEVLRSCLPTILRKRLASWAPSCSRVANSLRAGGRVESLWLAVSQLLPHSGPDQLFAFVLSHVHAGSQVRVNSYYPEYRVRMVRPQPESLSDDAKEEDILAGNIFSRYQNRPAEAEFESISLFEFASWWKARSSGPKERKATARGRKPNPSFKLQEGQGWIVKRDKEALVMTPYLTPEKNGHEYYYSLLCLYLPWCDEVDLKGDFPNENAAFEAKFDQLKANIDKFSSDMSRKLEEELRDDRVRAAARALGGRFVCGGRSQWRYFRRQRRRRGPLCRRSCLGRG